ncbi:MAG: FIST C-terminal domain-containing protein [Alphaproteobacteria bacterium]|nr:FIST C-terminal domain-containing protein [Alphaproteobacteria bacterium]
MGGAVNFAAAHARGETDADWGRLALDCVTQLGPAADQAELGFLYVTDALAAHLPNIVALLRQSTGVKTWAGSVGVGIAASGAEYFDCPAMAVLVAALPKDAWRLIPNLERPDSEQGVAPLAPVKQWADAQAGGPMSGPPLGVVHADPRNPQLAQLVTGLADAVSGFLVGGLASSRGAMDQVAGEVVHGGVSGVLFAPDVAIATGLSQGCSPIGPVRTVTAARQNVLFEIDGRPALEMFKSDIGEVLARQLEKVAGYIHAAFPVTGDDTGDYLVRNLIGIDPERGWLAVGEQVSPGDRILFVRRDRAAAEEDLVRMIRRLKRGAAAPKAGLYFSCVARGPNMFGPDSAELRILRRELGDFPLVGMFCNGEISKNRLYGYTGVLTLFL